MSTGFSQIIIIGNLGRDPEMRYTPSGQAVTSFNVAVNSEYKKADGFEVKDTMWYRVSVWGKMAEVTNQWLKKGRQVMVVGRLKGDPATGGPTIYKKQDGSAGAAFELTAQSVQFLGGNGAAAPSDEDAPVQETAGSIPAGGDIPF